MIVFFGLMDIFAKFTRIDALPEFSAALLDAWGGATLTTVNEKVNEANTAYGTLKDWGAVQEAHKMVLLGFATQDPDLDQLLRYSATIATRSPIKVSPGVLETSLTEAQRIALEAASSKYAENFGMDVKVLGTGVNTAGPARYVAGVASSKLDAEKDVQCHQTADLRVHLPKELNTLRASIQMLCDLGFDYHARRAVKNGHRQEANVPSLRIAPPDQVLEGLAVIAELDLTDYQLIDTHFFNGFFNTSKYHLGHRAKLLELRAAFLRVHKQQIEATLNRLPAEERDKRLERCAHHLREMESLAAHLENQAQGMRQRRPLSIFKSAFAMLLALTLTAVLVAAMIHFLPHAVLPLVTIAMVAALLTIGLRFCATKGHHFNLLTMPSSQQQLEKALFETINDPNRRSFTMQELGLPSDYLTEIQQAVKTDLAKSMGEAASNTALPPAIAKFLQLVPEESQWNKTSNTLSSLFRSSVPRTDDTTTVAAAAKPRQLPMATTRFTYEEVQSINSALRQANIELTDPFPSANLLEAFNTQHNRRNEQMMHTARQVLQTHRTRPTRPNGHFFWRRPTTAVAVATPVPPARPRKPTIVIGNGGPPDGFAEYNLDQQPLHNSGINAHG